MSKDDGGPAFPCQPLGTDGIPVDEMASGMSLREHFAGQALVGLLASGERGWTVQSIAHDAYRYADAMLAEREKKDE